MLDLCGQLSIVVYTLTGHTFVHINTVLQAGFDPPQLDKTTSTEWEVAMLVTKPPRLD